MSRNEASGEQREATRQAGTKQTESKEKRADEQKRSQRRVKRGEPINRNKADGE